MQKLNVLGVARIVQIGLAWFSSMLGEVDTTIISMDFRHLRVVLATRLGGRI